MTDKALASGATSYYSALTSMPMWAKYAQAGSVFDMPLERLLVMMKDPLDKKATDAFINDV